LSVLWEDVSNVLRLKLLATIKNTVTVVQWHLVTANISGLSRVTQMKLVYLTSNM